MHQPIVALLLHHVVVCFCCRHGVAGASGLPCDRLVSLFRTYGTVRTRYVYQNQQADRNTVISTHVVLYFVGNSYLMFQSIKPFLGWMKQYQGIGCRC